jgi:uroporphyrinogen-III synthase
MRVLVTRAEPGASLTLSRLAALGHQALAAPVLTIEPVPGAPPLDGVQALLFTSSNGVRAFAALSHRRDLPALCVGDATSDAACAAGFPDVRSADGDVGALAALAIAALSPMGGALLHAAGADVAGDLAGRLRGAGFGVIVHVCYRAVSADALPEAARHALAHAEIDAVLFHSARGAEAFVKQVNDSSTLARVDACCLSEAIADVARTAAWRRVRVASAPRESALLALLDAP